MVTEGFYRDSIVTANYITRFIFLLCQCLEELTLTFQPDILLKVVLFEGVPDTPLAISILS